MGFTTLLQTAFFIVFFIGVFLLKQKVGNKDHQRKRQY